MQVELIGEHIASVAAHRSTAGFAEPVELFEELRQCHIYTAHIYRMAGRIYPSLPGMRLLFGPGRGRGHIKLGGANECPHRPLPAISGSCRGNRLDDQSALEASRALPALSTRPGSDQASLDEGTCQRSRAAGYVAGSTAPAPAVDASTKSASRHSHLRERRDAPGLTRPMGLGSVSPLHELL